MFTVTLKTNAGEKSAVFKDRILLSSALEAMGITQHRPCGGKGSCKKCKVISNGKEVLSCQTYIENDTLVEYDESLENIHGITGAFFKTREKSPLLNSGYGLAVDIGTTTIAGYLYKFPECKCIKAISLPNTQAVYGADVVSRMEFSAGSGLDKLKGAVTGQIKKLSGDIVPDVYVITGNTVMLHLLTGKNPVGMASYPFTPASLFGKWYENVYIASCISAYIGADITTAVLSCGMMECKTALMVDIGTNCEIALWHDERLVCCSAAAGPAFEGAGLSCGVPAVSGAVNKVYIKNSKVGYTTIDNIVPTGICGTGVIDAVACMLELGIMDETGYIEDSFVITENGICITAEDVRQIQLAKSAVRSGIDTLLNICNVSCDEIENFYIAGGFGSYINCDNAAKIGLIPKELASKAIIAGNAAGGGACMMLLNKKHIQKTEEIARNAETIELSNQEYFSQRFVENMMF